MTRRQKEVGTLIAAGMEGGAIADLLGISPSTVEMHRRALYRTLGVSGAVELTHYALAKGWLRNKFSGPGRPRKPRD